MCRDSEVVGEEVLERGFSDSEMETEKSTQNGAATELETFLPKDNSAANGVTKWVKSALVAGLLCLIFGFFVAECDTIPVGI